MWKYIDTIPYMPLVVVTIVMLLTPFFPMPHILEKLLMLKNGTLHKPIDIFDLFFHLFPLLVLGIKLLRSAMK